jgi:hypothetical protein
MIETIRTFTGKVSGQHPEKKTSVYQGKSYRCTRCGLIFTDKEEAERHARREHLNK